MSISSKNHSSPNFQGPALLGFFCHHLISFKNLIISAGGTRQALTSKSDFEPKFAQCSVRCTMVECTTQEFWYQIMRCLLLHFSRRLTSRGIKSTNQIDLVEWSRDGHKEGKEDFPFSIIVELKYHIFLSRSCTKQGQNLGPFLGYVQRSNQDLLL